MIAALGAVVGAWARWRHTDLTMMRVRRAPAQSMPGASRGVDAMRPRPSLPPALSPVPGKATNSCFQARAIKLAKKTTGCKWVVAHGQTNAAKQAAGGRSTAPYGGREAKPRLCRGHYKKAARAPTLSALIDWVPVFLLFPPFSLSLFLPFPLPSFLPLSPSFSLFLPLSPSFSLFLLFPFPLSPSFSLFLPLSLSFPPLSPLPLFFLFQSGSPRSRKKITTGEISVLGALFPHKLRGKR